MYVVAFTELFSLNSSQFNLGGVNKLRDLLKNLQNIYTSNRLIAGNVFNRNDINTALQLLDQLNLRDIGLYTIQKYLDKVLDRIDGLDPIRKQSQIEKLSEFNLVCLNHINFFIDILDQMAVYLNSDRILHYDQTLFNKITQLGGVSSVYNKYLKYKQKYLMK